MLLHGIMSSIAEFYSRNLAAEVTKGMTQKVAAGGTPSRAPIGYLNVRKRDDQGCEYRTVEIDPDRAPLIRWVFDTYAKGEHTVPDLLAEATARGLTTVPTPKRPSGPVGRSTFFKLLRNPYYIGQVRYQGALHPGAHEPIVDPEAWQQVQTLLDTRATAGERRRKHDHYLKGTLCCGTCKSRLQLDYARNKQGIRYAYYICTGRATKRTRCTRKAVPVGIAEQLVTDCYQHIAISPSTYAQLAQRVEAAFDWIVPGLVDRGFGFRDFGGIIMGSTRRSFTAEYKASAVAFVLDEGRQIVEVARNIGVHEMTLGKWVKKERDAREAIIPPDASLTMSERAELIRLREDYKTARSENAQLRMEAEFAKKVATWFANDQQ